MILQGSFVLISVESREGSNGRMYYNVNLESEDGKVNRVGVNEEVVPVLTEKYKKYDGFFDVGSYKGEMYMRLCDARLVGK